MPLIPILWTLLTSRISHLALVGLVAFSWGYHKAAVAYSGRELVQAQKAAAESARRAIVLDDMNDWALRDIKDISDENARLTAQIKDIDNASKVNDPVPCLDAHSVRRLNRIGK